jgi:hypothetical protein
MTLEFYEAFNNVPDLKKADPELYKATEFLEDKYAQYFENVKEDFSFTISDNYDLSFTQSINFSLRKNSPTSVDFPSLVKEMALKAFNVEGNAAPKIGYIDDRYSNFIRTIKGNGQFQETYDSLNNAYNISRSMSLKNGAYKDSQKDEKWSSEFNYSIAVDQSGSVSVTESGNIKGRTSVDLETEASTKKNEDSYENAFQGLLILKAGAYGRCKVVYDDFIKSTNPKASWLPSLLEWNDADDLKEKHVSFGRNLNRQGGSVSYTLAFTTNPRMHNDAIFTYTISGSKGQNNITSMSESGTIAPYDLNKNVEFINPAGETTFKTLYDKFCIPADVIARMKPVFDSIKGKWNEDGKLVHPKNLTNSSVSFAAYGVEVSYSFAYSDDPTLRDDTYIRKLNKSVDYTMPTALRSSVLAPNLKETNYDSNQSSEGSKSLSMNVIFKRNPTSNKINKAHATYLKNASDSVFASLKKETQNSAFVTSPQVGKNELTWYLTDMQYSITSDYGLTYSAGMNFIDKKGVAAEALEY